jgi:hypothetical protein
MRKAFEWAIMVACPEKEKARVSRAAERVLGL